MSFYSAGVAATPGAKYAANAAAAASPLGAASFREVRTNRQARHLLGIAADYLKQGFRITEDVPTSIWWGVLARRLDNTAALAAQMRDLLSRSNAYAQRVYASIPDNDEALSTTHRNELKVALSQAATNLQLVSSSKDAIHTRFADAMLEALKLWVNAIVPQSKGIPWRFLFIAGGVAGALYGISRLMSSAAELKREFPSRPPAPAVPDELVMNPPPWVADPDLWEQARLAVLPYRARYDNPAAVTTHIYKQMGGRQALAAA